MWADESLDELDNVLVDESLGELGNVVDESLDEIENVLDESLDELGNVFF